MKLLMDMSDGQFLISEGTRHRFMPLVRDSFKEILEELEHICFTLRDWGVLEYTVGFVCDTDLIQWRDK